MIPRSVITCPECGVTADEEMPTDACIYFYECKACRQLLKPLAGDCCVFCSFGSVKCPPVQLEKGCCVDDSKAPWHAHIYYAPADRGHAEAFRASLIRLQESGQTPQLQFIGELRDHKVGPHPVPQFEIHFTAVLVPTIVGLIRESGLTALVHPLTRDDLADHTGLGRWIGTPINLDLTVLDPPGINQGFARFGKTDF